MIVSIIIPVFGQWELTKNCLISLKKEIKNSFEVILVDNGANVLKDDETRLEAPLLGKELFGDNFIYLPQEKNINFAGACNLGAKKAKSSLLFFLNNDTEVLPNFLHPLLDAMSNNKMKMVGPLLLYPPDKKFDYYTIQHIGVFFNPFMRVGHIYQYFPADHRIIKNKRKLQCITGAAFLISKENFLNLNAFDEAYINGFEDIDFCGKFIEKNGSFEIITNSKIVHFASQSEGRKDKDEHNVQVLWNKRHKFHPDLHLLLEADGYKLRYNEFLECVPCVNKELVNDFNILIKNNNMEKIKEQYEKEPYWHEGLYALCASQKVDIEEKWNILHQANVRYLPPNLFFEYVHLTLSLYGDIETVRNQLYGIFMARFSTYLNEEDFSSKQLERLQINLPFLKDTSDNLYREGLNLVRNHQYYIDRSFKILWESHKLFDKYDMLIAQD